MSDDKKDNDKKIPLVTIEELIKVINSTEPQPPKSMWNNILEAKKSKTKQETERAQNNKWVLHMLGKGKADVVKFTAPKKPKPDYIKSGNVFYIHAAKEDYLFDKWLDEMEKKSIPDDIREGWEEVLGGYSKKTD